VTVSIRKLRPEERDRVFPTGRRQPDVSAYVDALRELRAGDVAAIGLQDLPSRTVKRRFTLAAKQLGYRIKWSTPSGEDELFLRIEQVPVDGTSWAPKRRRRTALGRGR
jgi:hypothetical protein